MVVNIADLKQFEVRFNNLDEPEVYYASHKHEAVRAAVASRSNSTVVSVEELNLFEVKCNVRGSKERYRAEIFARDSSDAVVRAKAGPFKSAHYKVYMITKIR